MVKKEKDVWGNELDCEVYLDGYIDKTLKNLKKFLEKNWDSIGLVIGYEGDGKTAMAMQMCYAFDKSFTVDRIVFTAEQFEEVVDQADQYQAILWDESDDIGSNWNSKIMQSLKKKFKRIRKQNLFIILVTPTIFDLDKYFVMHRTRWLIHVYSKGFKRGYMRFFGQEKKKQLYLDGKRKWDLRAARPDFHASFTDYPPGWPIDMEEYEEKKDKATQKMLEDPDSPQQRMIRFRRGSLDRLDKMLEQKYEDSWTQKEYAHVFDVERSTISRDFKEL